MANPKKKKSWLGSAWRMRCPRCREGALFGNSSFAFAKPFTMLEKCEVCDQSYNPEPGFYFGAMFISYILWGWFSILFCLLLILVFGWSINGAFALLILLSVVLFVWIFRFSRSLWIHIIIRYKSDSALRKNNS